MDYMLRAIELAKKGSGFVSPNPMVGAVIVKNNKIIAEGYHHQYGAEHAEIDAFNNATVDVIGADMYVTLEPCAHYGKTPPCAHKIVENKIKRVYVGLLDPNPLVSGKGIDILKNSGIEVITGMQEEKCRELNSIFLKFITTKTPYVIMKTAMTLDGKISTYTGDSKWVSCEESRKFTHHLRHSIRGIMVGINTVLSDDPTLTCRIDNGRNPVKIIVDSTLKIPINAKVIDNNCIIATTENIDYDRKNRIEELGAKVLIINKDENNKINLKELMTKLGAMNIDSILLEGGGTLNYSALENNIVDKVISFVSPKIIGGINAKTPVEGNGIPQMANAIDLKNIKVKNIGSDILIYGDIKEV